jgi:hypothetical protein
MPGSVLPILAEYFLVQIFGVSSSMLQHAEGPSVFLHGHPRQHVLPAGWGPLSHQQKIHGLPQGEGGRVYCAGLAGEFARLEPNQKCVGPHEAEAQVQEGQEHEGAEGGDHHHVGGGHAPRLLPEALCIDA